MPNRLASETSPYLLQHADNPVDWWPWCPEALELANRQDKPILLSIGYSACHWCHVMAHESFENANVASVMNRHFVNIKVDREERPDLDHIYQSAHQMLNRRPAGWPLTMFLSPDGTPFMAGTYFPRLPRYRLPGFVDLLTEIATAFRKQRKGIEKQNAALRAELAKTAGAGGAHHSEFDAAPLSALRDFLSNDFDEQFGGFGEAPKFPRASDLEFLLQRYRTAGDERARDMALLTLTRMAEGGLNDHLGGGFCRYSTDERWHIPHFEKMLYDNGPLIELYAQAWQVGGETYFRQTVESAAGWVLREMQSPEGGYYSSLDADTEGHEGRFYVWDRDEVARIVGDAAYPLVARHYGLDQAPNFEGKYWHLCVVRGLSEVAGELGIAPDDAATTLAGARDALFKARAQRTLPGCDHKILTSWNALTIAGLARAARVFDQPQWLASARRALTFVRERMWRDGRLLATYAGGEGRLNAYLDDHAFLIDALVELMQTDFEAADLEFAEDLADALLESFEDRASGGFFFTRHDHEVLIQRPKPIHDSATASGNGVAARALGRLGHLTGEIRYLDATERTLQAFYPALERSPAGCASLALALEESLAPPTVVVVRGDEAQLGPWRKLLAERHLPDVLGLVIPTDMRDLPPVLEGFSDLRVNATVCTGVNCQGPIFDLAELETLFRNNALRG